jgi:tetratricopeptide (TPR) repeat protein
VAAIPLPECCQRPVGPLEKRLFEDAESGRWHEHTLLEAALLASGVDHPETLRRYQRRVAQLVDELRRSGEVAGPPLEQAQAIFEFMHRRILTGGYQLDGTDLSIALDQGRFNCVSASVLFNCLAGEFGVRTCGLEIPGHAMSRVLLENGHFDVETTCPAWFRLRHDPQKQAELVRQSLGLRPGQARNEPREVSDVELVATIYYNRGVDLLSQKRFSEAAAANAKALRLDPANVTARGNLLATLNNWAIDLATSGDYPHAAGLLARGMELDSGYETFRANFVHVHYQWIEDLCRRQRFQDALDLLATAAQALPADPYFKQARQDIYRRWAQARSETAVQSSGTPKPYSSDQ